jgi:alkyldihydroxyacetonephosphate synthase
MGYAVETVETATDWASLPDMLDAVEESLHAALAGKGEHVHVFTHLSHVYPSGSTCYSTFVFRLAADPDENLSRGRALKATACEAIVAHGGTISHQHGVGVDHMPYLAAEKGELGIRAIAGLCKTFDPAGMMNPGKLVT